MMKRVMGLDVGKKTIGVAVSDPLGITALGVVTLRRHSLNEDYQSIYSLIQDYQVGEIVVGLPRHMNGSLGREGEDILVFGKKLENQMGLPVFFWDERLTTVAAEKVLLEGDLSRNKRKKVIDKIAACFILSGYLDRKKRKSEYSQDNEK